MTEAGRLGYRENKGEWANLGQGAPETSYIEGAPERIDSVSFSVDELEYAPVDGLLELREAVAELYNERYRKNKSSKYTSENVAIAAGGRLSLTRLVSTLGKTNIGHLLPDYTAYEELLDCFGSFSPIPILLDSEKDYNFSIEELRSEILGRGLSALLFSNPCNPTGKLLAGDELASWVKTSRELDCCLIIDEFYSHYIYRNGLSNVSAAEYVDDVNSDPVIIIDGLTKNWRYPGFRVSWTLAPKDVIDAVGSAGSFLDGGCSRPMQLAALKVVNTKTADEEAQAIHSVFSKKRSVMLSALSEMGIKVSPSPDGAFYCWGDLSELPESIRNGMSFFQRGLEEKVITVPGEFFDINPGQRRSGRPSRFRNFTRFSFGPSLSEIERGLAGLRKVVENAS